MLLHDTLHPSTRSLHIIVNPFLRRTSSQHHYHINISTHLLSNKQKHSGVSYALMWDTDISPSGQKCCQKRGSAEFVTTYSDQEVEYLCPTSVHSDGYFFSALLAITHVLLPTRLKQHYIATKDVFW